MNRILKYDNTIEELPNLAVPLRHSLENDFLEIKLIICNCDKFQNALVAHSSLEFAKYVIYSPYIDKKDHNYESFIFIDETGNIVCSIPGIEMSLYGMLNGDCALHISDEFLFKSDLSLS